MSAQNGKTGATKKKQPMNLSTRQTQLAIDQSTKNFNLNGNLNTGQNHNSVMDAGNILEEISDENEIQKELQAD